MRVTIIYSKLTDYIIFYSIIKNWTTTTDEIKILKTESPVLYGLYISIVSSNDHQQAKAALINVFAYLIEKFRNFIYENCSKDHTETITENEYKHLIENTDDHTVAPSFEISELWKTGFFFPDYNVKRKIVDVKTPGEKFACNKNYHTGRTMGPGVIFFCVEHEQCIGFIVLDKPESLRVITHTILTRFDKIPKLILYDNGCNLNEYILNRYPWEFKDSRILVDGFHFNSHTNCSPIYDSSALPAMTRNLNTSLVEQKNSRFAKMKMYSPFLKLETFMSKLRYSAMVVNSK